MARPYILAEASWQTVKDTRYETAVMTWGATEAHNYHLPYGTDNYQAEHVAERAVGRAWELGSKVILLPGIAYGVNTGQLDVSLCMNMMPSTQLAILKDICDVLQRHGIKKLVIINGHGANNFVGIIRELALLYPDVMVTVVNWYVAAPRNQFFERPGDHADEFETSCMMHIAPHLVQPLETAGDGATKKFTPSGFQEGWAWTQRPWTKVTRDTGSGNPYLATREKGEKFLDATVNNIANFLHQLSSQTIDEMIQ